MGKIAFIADIHANIHALDLVLEDISKRNVDKIVCLGDLVVKFLYPKEVINEVRKNCDIVIKGNCDDLVANDERYVYARTQIGVDGIEYLNNLPVTHNLKINNILLNLFHSNPNDLESIFNPIINSDINDKKQKISDYRDMFISNEPQITIVGHTHQDYIGVENNNKLDIISNKVIIDKNKRTIINVGSVGEHDHLYEIVNDKYITRLDPYITYLLLTYDKEIISAEIIKIKYLEKLINIYFDFLDRIDNNTAPANTYYINKIHNSLNDLGYDDKKLSLRKKEGK